MSDYERLERKVNQAVSDVRSNWFPSLDAWRLLVFEISRSSHIADPETVLMWARERRLAAQLLQATVTILEADEHKTRRWKAFARDSEARLGRAVANYTALSEEFSRMSAAWRARGEEIKRLRARLAWEMIGAGHDEAAIGQAIGMPPRYPRGKAAPGTNGTRRRHDHTAP